MGILSEMFDEREETGGSRKELLASGQFLYSAEDVLTGYEIFRKRYIAKQTAFKVAVGIAALLSSCFMIYTEENKLFPIMCAAVCLVCIGWFIKTPIENRKKTAESVKSLTGSCYLAQIYADAARIVLLDDSEEEGDPPTTLIHLDQYVADFLTTETLYIIVVAKRYVFVIPKSAFSEEEQARVAERLPLYLDSRYKVVK